MADDEQPLVDADDEQQPLVPKKKSRALVAGAAFGAALRGRPLEPERMGCAHGADVPGAVL